MAFDNCVELTIYSGFINQNIKETQQTRRSCTELKNFLASIMKTTLINLNKTIDEHEINLQSIFK